MRLLRIILKTKVLVIEISAINKRISGTNYIKLKRYNNPTTPDT